MNLLPELDRLNILDQCPSHIVPRHWEEWAVGSAVHPDLVALNVRSLEDIEIDPLSNEVIATPIHDLLNWKYVRFGRQASEGMRGWAVSGVDPLNDCQPAQHVRFKPDAPLVDRASGRPIRYLSPKGAVSCATFLKVSWEVGLTIARRQGHEKTYTERLLQAYEASQAEAQSRETIGAITEIGDFSEAVVLPGNRRVASTVLPPRSFLCTEDSAFWCWIHRESVAITYTEGEKKAGCLLSQGVAAIALPGITMGVRTRDKEGNSTLSHLIPELQYFATPGREISICFDYETRPKTRQAVERETEKLKIQLSKAKCFVKIISLPGPEKGVDDFVVAQGADAFHKAYDAALSFEQWQVRRYTHLSYPASVTLNQRYLGTLTIPDGTKLVVLRSPKGTGKTESFVDLVAEATANGQRTLLISHRVQLAQAICDRVGLPFITEVRTSESGSLLGYGLCIDSLHPESQARFNADYWDDALVIIDECEQVFWHALSASTEVSNHRISVLEELKKLLTNVLASDRGRIILSDADLSNLSIEFVQALVETKVEPWVVTNEWQAEAWKIHHYAQKSPEQWLAALDAEIDEGGRPFVVTQSQRSKSRWSSSTLERVFRARYPNKKILRIDSETIADPTHEAYLCTAHLNDLLSRYDIVIASPSIETGVSIDIRGHFTSVWGCLNGVTPENSARQSLARVREPVPRHIWIARHGLGKIGSGSTSVKALLSAEYQLARVATKLVQILSFNEDMLTAYSAALKIWAKMAARINAGQIHYRNAVLAGLETEGHQIVEAIAAQPVRALMEEVQEIRDTHYQAECEAIATAGEMSQKEFEESKKKKAKPLTEAHRERKFMIQQRYQIDVTPELVAKDDDGWHPKLRLHYFLTMGRQFLQERDRQALEHVTQTSGFWLPTLNRSQLTVKVMLLEALKIKVLLDPDAEFNGGTKKQGYQNTHPLLWELGRLARYHRWNIKTVLGVTISEDMSPIQIAQVLLGKLGIKLKCDRQEGGKGDRQRIYRFLAPKDGRNEILTGWFTRDEVSRNDSAMHTPGISKEIPAGVGSAA